MSLNVFFRKKLNKMFQIENSDHFSLEFELKVCARIGLPGRGLAINQSVLKE